jgi:transposase
MAVSEERRRELHERLLTQLDDETVTLLMEVTVPANVELATRGDVQELRAELLLRLTEVDGHLTLQMADLVRRISALEGDLEQQVGKRISAIEAGLATLDVRMDRVDVKLSALDVKLTRSLYRAVLPTLIAVQLLLFAASTRWVG